ncbi:unnamed protein product [Caenorhabditis brenneri]
MSVRMIQASKGQVIKMTSALGNAQKNKRENWPSTAIFETISQNIDGDGLSKSVQRSIQLGLEAENHVCCSCVGDCATNPNCTCLKTARLMENTLGGEIIHYGEPIHNPASGGKKMFWEKPRFVCGPRCSCRKECSLNPLQNIDKRQSKKFEILRTDERGFGGYALIDIKAGSAIASFNGELVGPKEVKKDINVHHYSLQIIAEDDPFWKILSKCKTMNKEYKNELSKAYRCKVFINPLKKGNFTRMFNHSCDPNMEILRVFQGGVSPADIRVVFTAIREIKAGEELTWHYGDEYFKEHFGGLTGCLCDKCEESRQPRGRKRNGSQQSKKAQVKKQRTQ